MFVRDYVCDEQIDKSCKKYEIFVVCLIIAIIILAIYGFSRKDSELVKYSLDRNNIKREVIKTDLTTWQCDNLRQKLIRQEPLSCDKIRREK